MQKSDKKILKADTTFKEEDLAGESTLDVIAKADKFNTWMYKTIKPFCKGRILEIGSGIGNISNYFLQDNFDTMLTDIRPTYCKKLKSKFELYHGFLGAEVMDLTDVNFDVKFAEHLGIYDTVFALNVVEHIFDDTLALKNCYKLLKEGGQLVILVPAYQCLYNNFDKELGHFRRYTISSLSKIFLTNEFRIVYKQYFNCVGIIGWLVSGGILKRKTIPGGQMKFYNTLVPIFKIIDRIIFNTVGLSTFIVGKK